MFSLVKKHFLDANISFEENVPLSKKTTFKIGGNALLYVLPKNICELAKAVEIAQACKAKFFVLGGGSNVVFCDEDFTSIIISTEKLCAIQIANFCDCTNTSATTSANERETDIETECDTSNTSANERETDVFVTCEAGTSVASLVSFCTKNNISGLEEFAGLPGSVGGATYMNARCFEKSFVDVLDSVEYLEILDDCVIQKNQKINLSEWDYKVSPFQNSAPQNASHITKKIICGVTLRLLQKFDLEHSAIEEDCKKYIMERVSKGHFEYPSAGSVFKNNRSFGKPSGRLIDEAGLKGYKIGGASIAPFHGNFIINEQNATSSDVKNLVEVAQKAVKEKFGFDLECEIIFVDN